MPMRIAYLNDRGIHVREILGVQSMRERLPKEWYGYASLEIVDPGHRAREVDLALVLPDRIVVADLKDWHGSIRSDGARWSQNNREPEGSPVNKIALNAKILAASLRRFVGTRSGLNAARGWIPDVQGCVVLTGSARIEAMPESERLKVFSLEDFVTILMNPAQLSKRFPDPGWVEHGALLEKGGTWRNNLNLFFTGGVFFRPQELKYADNRVCSSVTYAHPKNLYEEYDTQETNASRASGLLRSWDFSRADPRFLSQEGRDEIAGREREVLGYLTAGSEHLEGALLRHKVADADRGMRYWEVFERRRDLKRLTEFMTAEAESLTPRSRRDLIRVLLANMAAMHGLGATHEDLGGHSIWLALPSTVRLSHLMSARYPETRTLGARRYDFLSSGVHLPEDSLGGESGRFGKDVFLLGVAAHRIAFGKPPSSAAVGEPPEWRPQVDLDGSWHVLHNWFGKALDWEPAARFDGAAEMLEAFDRCIVPRHSGRESLARLDGHRRWLSLLDLFEEYPSSKTLRSDAMVIAYRSDLGSGSFMVKCWRPSNWGELQLNAPRLVAFCDRAEALGRCALPGIVAPTAVGFIPEALTLVQPFLPLPALSNVLEEGPQWLSSKHAVAGFLLSLCQTLDGLHEAGLAHGDLTPSNILLDQKESAFIPLLVDLVDFAPETDGEPQTRAFVPDFPATTSERDRFAALKIAELMLSGSDLGQGESAALALAVRASLEGPPPLLALSPLSEALAELLSPTPDEPDLVLEIAGPGLSTESLQADNGTYLLVADRVPRRLLLTGAVAELVLDFHDTGNLRAVAHRTLAQSDVAWRERRSMASFKGTVFCRALDRLVPDGLAPLLKLPAVAEWTGLLAGARPVEISPSQEPETYLDGPSRDELADPASEDPDSDQGLSGRVTQDSLDTKLYWRTAMEVEAEQVTDVLVDGDSTFSRTRGCHLVSISSASRAIDFDPDERVSVRRRTKSGNWFYLGRLANSVTSSETLGVVSDDGTAPVRGLLCREGDVLRLESLWELDSRRRRHAALRTLFEDRGPVPGLAEYFDGESKDSRTIPMMEVPRWPTPEELSVRYGLNESQAEAMASIRRPLVLLQGPPGTGKTTFIAALLHYCLSNGLVGNVLLASQSHEAVNTAAEGVVKLFRKEGEEPSLVRVGQEGSVSDLLKPFHSARIEEGFRERFRADLKAKLLLAAARMGLPEKFAEDFVFLELTVRPVVSHLCSANSAGTEGEAPATQLRVTLERLLDQIGIQIAGEFDCPTSEMMEDLTMQLINLHPEAAPDHGRRLAQLAETSRDWLNSVSGRHRNFESFLVATRRIVCGTCVGVGNSGLAIAPGSFDMVVVDEAARCAPGELAVPMVAGRWIVLVGDHRQLQPQVDRSTIREIARRLGVSRPAVERSDFERAFEKNVGGAAKAVLKTQYRMLPSIGELVSRCFYGGVLIHGRVETDIPAKALDGTLPSEVTWVDTGTETSARDIVVDKSFRNPSEAAAIAGLLRKLDQTDAFRTWLSSRNQSSEAIGVVCMYAAQRDLVLRELAATPLSQQIRRSLKVATVDGYQGKENDIVIVSLVRNNTDGPIEAGLPTIAQGFMFRPNRINVALSRARDRLVIVGSVRGWPMDGPLAAVSAEVRALCAVGEADVV